MATTVVQEVVGACGGNECLRDTMSIKSGTRVEIGCHHAEMNLICNSAANGVPTKGAWLIVTGEPCMMCAKLIHHAGIGRVVIVDGGFGGRMELDILRTMALPCKEQMDPKIHEICNHSEDISSNSLPCSTWSPVRNSKR